MMSIKFDKKQYDGQILLAADDRRGLGVFEIAFQTPAGIRSYRAAQSLPTEASSHTLQLLALLAALRDINRSLRNTISGRHGVRPRFRVVTTDATFADALRALLNGDADLIRAGGNFIEEARRVFSNFALTVAVEKDNSVFILRQWAQKHVAAPDEIDASEAIFRHAAIGAKGPHF
jgi:hypothetical protein